MINSGGAKTTGRITDFHKRMEPRPLPIPITDVGRALTDDQLEKAQEMLGEDLQPLQMLILDVANITPTSPAHLVTVLGVRRQQVDDAFEPLVEAGLLCPDEGGIRFILAPELMSVPKK